jgi:orotate phosphoribosyltransferase
MEARERLGALLRQRALVRGAFRLASGQISDHYFDCKRVTLDPEGAHWTAEAILDLIEKEGLHPEAVGGPTIGADPIAAAVALRSRERGRPLPAFLVRGRAKDHGTGRTIENAPPPGARVLVVEDVITTAASTLGALREVEEAGLKVEAVVCLVDREQGGAEALSAYRFLPLFRRSELL